MKKTYLLTLLFALMLNFAQAQTNKTKKEDMISLTTYMLSGKDLTLKVGQKATISMTVHGSVGITADAYSNDEKIVKLVKSNMKYENEEWQKAEEEEKPYQDKETGEWVVPAKKPLPSGGDEATKTYIFEAVKEGKVVMVVEEGYRGDIKKHFINVKVINK